ncbi:MAG TPA: hypothetical protein VGN52_18490 [Burkholderiales bacterium]
MTRESIVSFLLAVCVVGGSVYVFARLGGIGSVHKAIAAPLPDTSQKATPPAAQAPGAAKLQPLVAGPCKGAECASQTAQASAALAQGEQITQAEVPEDEDAAQPVAGKPRCHVLSHQIAQVDGALSYPLSQALQAYYHKHKQELKDEEAKLGC